MFRDKDEALARLEEELLEEDAPTPEEPEAEEEETFLEAPSGDTAEYKNFANNYNAYNADHTDLDLEEFSEEIYASSAPRHAGLLATVFLLLAGILLVLGWWLLRYLGVIG